MARDEPGTGAGGHAGADATGGGTGRGPAGRRRSARSRPPDRAGLTPRQRKVLEVIRDWVERFGYPPSVREIGDAVGLTSTSSVHTSCAPWSGRATCAATPTAPRASTSAARGRRGRGDPAGADDRGHAAPTCPAAAFVPLLGNIAAGGPILAEQAVESVFPLPREIVGEGTLFLLNVAGDSMVEAAITDGDWVVVRQQPVAENGEIVAAMIDGEATVKTFKRGTGTSGCCRPTRPTSPSPATTPRCSAGSWRCCAGSDAPATTLSTSFVGCSGGRPGDTADEHVGARRRRSPGVDHEVSAEARRAYRDACEAEHRTAWSWSRA